MKVGDLVRYREQDQPTGSVREALEHQEEHRGIVTQTGALPDGRPQCHVVWYTCTNKGWWNSEYLEVISESR
jgi:hypothetical protein